MSSQTCHLSEYIFRTVRAPPSLIVIGTTSINMVRARSLIKAVPRIINACIHSVTSRIGRRTKAKTPCGDSRLAQDVCNHSQREICATTSGPQLRREIEEIELVPLPPRLTRNVRTPSADIALQQTFCIEDGEIVVNSSDSEQVFTYPPVSRTVCASQLLCLYRAI